MRYVTGVLAILVLVVMLVFGIQNREVVDVSFLVWTMSLPKIFLILGIYALGMVSGVGLIELIKRAF